MTKTESDVESFLSGFLDEPVLSHAYASKYYDPAKAHAYYMRTRKLKGRKSGSTKELRSKKKKETWAVAKDSINQAKRAEIKAAGDARTKKVTQIRAGTKAKRNSIAASLKNKIAQISKKNKASREKLAVNRKRQAEKLAADTKKKIAAVPPVPKGLKGEARARAVENRAKKVDAIRGEAGKERDKISNQTRFYNAMNSNDSRKAANAERESARKEREKVATFTKALVGNARTEWQAKKEAITAKYEKELDKEFEAIKKSKS